MTDGNTYAINKYLADREEFDRYQELLEAEEQLGKLSDLCEQLVEAIKPFADFARAHAVDAPEWTDRDHIKVIVSIGDLRAVASALDAYEASK